MVILPVQLTRRVVRTAIVCIIGVFLANKAGAYEFDTTKLTNITRQFVVVDLTPTNTVETFGDLEDEYRLSHWNTEHGLPINRVQAIAKSGDGYLWVATFGGLARFDGHRFTAFTKASCSLLNYDAFDVLASHPDGTIFARSGDPHFDFFIKDGELIRVGETGRRKPVVRELDVNADGRLLLLPFDDWQRQLADEGLPPFPTGGPPGPGVIIGHGLSHPLPTVKTATPNDWLYEGAAEEFLPGSGSASYLTVGWQAAWHSWNTNSTWYVWPGNQVHSFRPGESNWRFDYSLPKIEGVGIWRMIAVDREGAHWFFAGPGHVVRRKPDGQLDTANLRDRFGLDSFSGGLMDEEGVIWIGSAQGLSKLERRRARNLTTKHGLPTRNILSIAGRTNGLVTVGTAGGVVVYSNEVPVLRWARTNSYSGNYVRSILPLSSGQIVMNEGLLYDDGHFFMLEGLHPVFGLATSRAIYEDSRERLWFSGTAGWVARFDSDGLTVFRDELKLPQKAVVSIHEARDGTMYLGTAFASENSVHGTRVLHPDGSVTFLTATNGPGSDRVWSMHEDADGCLWFGTDHGVSRLKDGRFFNFTPADGLAEEYVNSILEDDFGDFWLAGLRGIHRVSRRALNDYADGRTNRFEVLSVTEADGLLSAETNGENQPSAWKAPDGELWFPTVDGIAIIDPRRFRNVASRVRVAIEKVVFDDEVVFDSGPAQVKWRYREPDGRLKLGPHRGRTLLVQYAGIQFGSQHLMEFEARLEGVDPDWRQLGNQRQVFYANVPPGSYRLHLRARDQAGLFGEPVQAFALELVPAFYQRPAFWWSSAATATLLVWLGHRRRVLQVRRVESLRRETAVSQERERIARDMHDDLGSRLAHIRMLVEMSQDAAEATVGDDARARLGQAAQQAMRSMEEIVWAANPRNDNLAAAVEFYCQYAEEFLHAAGVAVRIDCPAQLPVIPVDPPVRHGLLLAHKEVLHNVVRHAKARQVEVRIEWAPPILKLIVQDDGVGFEARQWEESPANGAGNGNHDGLINLRERMSALAGACRIESRPRNGTCVELEVSIPAPEET